MNIALFTDCYYPTKNGVVTVVHQLRESLEKEGHHVVIVTTKPEGDYDDDPNVYRAENSIAMGLGNVKDQYLAIIWWPKLKKFLKAHNIQIIHCHTELTVGWMAHHAAKKLHIPCVMTTHTMWEDYIKNYVPMTGILIPYSFWYSYLRRVYKNFNCMIGVSDKVRKFNKQDKLVPQIPNFVIHNSLNPEKFMIVESDEKQADEAAALRKKLNIADDETMILYVGRIAIEKRSLSLFNALLPVLEANTKAKVVFVGDGPIFKQLTKTAKLAGYEDRFIFTGFVDWKNVGTYYKAADIFTTASITECCPMTVIEAFLASTPVICRKDDAYSFSVIEGVTGYQAETDEEMTEKIISLSKDKELQKTLGQNAKEKSKEFLPDVFVHRHLHLYQTLLDSYPDVHFDEAAFQKELDDITC